MRRGFPLSLASLLVLCAGCGGGSTSSGGGGGGTPPPPVPALNSIAPSSANAGSAQLTLTLYGSNFDQGATVQWSGANLSTTWVSATTLTAAVPAANLAATGSIQVRVSNSGSNSASRTFTVAAAPTASTWVRAVAGITDPNRTVWDSARAKLYVSMSSADPASPDSILPVDPVAGTAGTPIPAGTNPNLMSLSSDGSYLWVALDGDNTVQRFALPALTKDISVPVPLAAGAQKQLALSLEAAPVNPHTMAIVAGNRNISTPGNGIYVFDDATQRSKSVPGPIPGPGPNADWIQWGANDSVIYAVSPALATLTVDASGVTWNKPAFNSTLSPGPAYFEPASGLLYWSTWVFDPVKNVQAGIFGGGGQAGIGLAGGCAATAVNPRLGRFYCVLEGTFINPQLLVFDQKSYDFLGTYDLGTGINWQGGVSQYLVPWGNAGLALLVPASPGSVGGLYLIDGAAVNPSAPPDSVSGTPVSSLAASLAAINPQGTAAGSQDLTLTVTGSGFTQSSLIYSDYGYAQAYALPTAYVSPTQLTATLPAGAMTNPAPLIITVWDDFAGRQSTNSLVFTVYPNSGNTQVRGINVSGLSMAWDASASLLYVGTSFYDPVHPNSIVAIDPTTGATVSSAPVAPEPDLLDIASDNSRLFIGYAASTTVSELSLPGLNSPISWPLIDPQGAGPYTPGDLKAAPGSPATAAVTLYSMSSTPSAQGGIVIFDDGVARPDFAPGWGAAGNPGAIYDMLAWSNTNTSLAAAESSGDASVLQPFYTLNVGSSGVAYSATFGQFNAVGSRIHSDFGTGFIYSDDGLVASPFDGSMKGNYGASGLVVPDSSTQRAYILGQTAAQQDYNYTIDSFNETSFAPVSSITLPTLTGIPFNMVKCGPSCLAILAFNPAANANQGPETMLYIVRDTSFVSNLMPAVPALPSAERVQARWPRLTSPQIIRKFRSSPAVQPAP